MSIYLSTRLNKEKALPAIVFIALGAGLVALLFYHRLDEINFYAATIIGSLIYGAFLL